MEMNKDTEWKVNNRGISNIKKVVQNPELTRSITLSFGKLNYNLNYRLN